MSREVDDEVEFVCEEGRDGSGRGRGALAELADQTMASYAAVGLGGAALLSGPTSVGGKGASRTETSPKRIKTGGGGLEPAPMFGHGVGVGGPLASGEGGGGEGGMGGVGLDGGHHFSEQDAPPPPWVVSLQQGMLSIQQMQTNVLREMSGQRETFERFGERLQSMEQVQHEGAQRLDRLEQRLVEVERELQEVRSRPPSLGPGTPRSSLGGTTGGGGHGGGEKSVEMMIGGTTSRSS